MLTTTKTLLIESVSGKNFWDNEVWDLMLLELKLSAVLLEDFSILLDFNLLQTKARKREERVRQESDDNMNVDDWG